MVALQLAGRDIADERVLEVFRKVPRHLFVRESLWGEAYNDYPLPIGDGQTISQPYIVALMTQCLCLKGDEKVLEVGTGSGYQAAILGELAKEIYSIERNDRLAKNAQSVIEKLGYKNIHIKTGDGTEGWSDFSPYNCIIVTAGSPSVPKPLKEQLAERGRLVIPIGSASSQILKVITKRRSSFIEEDICGCVFVPLLGRYGWNG